MNFFATAAKGTEGLLRDELRDLRMPRVRADRGGVHFEGGWRDAFRACYESRIAMRILALCGRFEARNGDELYEGVSQIDWSQYIDARSTIAVKATCRSSKLTHTQFIAQKTKDAIVDQIRSKSGARPSVDLNDPDLNVAVHLVNDMVQLYVDVSGEPLHKRRYRTEAGEAPLKETLAAAMVRFSGWQRGAPLPPFADPMCGSGTIAIEAALIAANIPPGWQRTMGIERWLLCDETLKAEFFAVREKAKASVVGGPFDIRASDSDDVVLRVARQNASRAGVAFPIVRADVSDDFPLPGGVIVTNPPYGERLEGSETLYRQMASSFRASRAHTVCVICGSRELEDALNRTMRPARWLLVFNGPLSCKLIAYENR